MTKQNFLTQGRRQIVILVVSLFVCIGANAQQIKLNFTSTPLKSVLKELHIQSGYSFAYSNDLKQVNNNITCNITSDKENIKEVLEQLFKDMDISYTITRKHIVLSPKQENKKQDTRNDKISGKVTDENGEPLPGVFIVNASGKNTFSDINGFFEIEAKNGESLSFQFIGMQDLTVQANSQKKMTVNMKSDLIALEDVVVTGYQSISKDRAAGAVSVVSAKDLQDRPSTNLSSAMDGMFSGVRVYGEGGSEQLTIRGIGTMTSSITSPLIVVDGFIVEDGLSSINPSDVESIHILKDASAASIWGARSSNGVVVITTKKARSGMKISFNSFVTVEDKIDLDQANPIASSKDALKWEKYLYDYDKTFSSFSISPNVDGNNNPATYGIQYLEMLKRGRMSESEFKSKWAELENTNYQDDVYKHLLKNAVKQNYELSINGSSEKNQYVFNARYNRNASGYVGNRNDQILINFRNTYKITKWLDLNFSLMNRFTNNDNSGVSLSDIKSMSPYEKLLNSDGSYSKMVGSHYQEFIDNVNGSFPKDWNYNLLQDIGCRDLTSQSHSFRLQTSLNFKLFKGLTYELKFQYEKLKTEIENYYSVDSYYVRDQLNKWVDYDEANRKVTKEYLPDGGMLDKSYNSMNSYYLGNQVKYHTKIDRHEINAGVFTEISTTVNKGYSAPTVFGYDPDRLTSVTPEVYYPIGSYWGAKNYSVNGMDQSLSYSDKRFFSLLANAAYSFDEKYSVTGSIRVDASNMIVDDPKYRYAPFWSVGANWKMDKENFIRDLNVFDRLNLRVSYGHTGNVVTTTSFVPLVNMMGFYSPTGVDYAAIQDYGNPTLTWERTKTTNVGIDFSIKGTRLYGSLEYYNKYGVDIVGAVDLPRVTGTSQQSFNTAELVNKGFEISLNYELGNKDGLSWLTKLNYSYNKSEVKKLNLVSFTYSSLALPHFEEGKPVGAIYSYKYLGMAEDGMPYIQGIGDNKWSFSGTQPSTSDHRDYMIYSGSNTPTSLFGWQNNIRYRGFNLSFYITGEFGAVFRKPTFNYPILTNAKTSSILHKDVVAVMDGTATHIPTMPSTTESNLSAWGSRAQYLNTLIEDASHIRLQEINLSYTFPQRILKRIQNLRLYCQMRNVGLIWTANSEGLDPRYVYNSTIAVANPRSYTFGLSFDF